MSGDTERLRQCRRCLLRDMTDENDYYQSVLFYRSTLPKKKRTPDEAYERRLQLCLACGELQNATCMQCGCMVEMRAARADMHCPMERW